MDESKTAQALKASGSEYHSASINQLSQSKSFFDSLKYYLQLTKPTIMLLVVITGGTANAFNQYFEREIDAKMTRTMKRRPLPMGQISPKEAAAFSILLGGTGVILLGVMFNILTVAISLGTLLFYSLFYTLYLKPNTPQNIVIGGIAGSMAPIGAWTAATGAVTFTPIILFLIVFLWTPPHFRSLAMCYKDDYEKANLPMMPVIKGGKSTMRQIVVYTMILIAVSFTYLLTGGGVVFGVSALALGGFLLKSTIKARKLLDKSALWRLFGFSIIYLLGLFLAMIGDKFVNLLIAS